MTTNENRYYHVDVRLQETMTDKYLLTALAWEVMQSPTSIRPSLRPFVSTPSSESTDR